MQAAARAAERRARDNVWCPCGDHGTDVQYTDGQVVPSDALQTTASRPQNGTIAGKQQQLVPPRQTISDKIAQPLSLGSEKPKGSASSVDTPRSSATSIPGSEVPAIASATRPIASNRVSAQHGTQENKFQTQVAQQGLGLPTAGTAELVDLTMDDDDHSRQSDALKLSNKRARRTSPANCGVGQLQVSSERKGFRTQTASNGSQVEPTTLSSASACHAGPVHRPPADLLGHPVTGATANSVAAVGTDYSVRNKSTHSLQAFSQKQWSCIACTLFNPELSLQCAVCGAIQPANSCTNPEVCPDACEHPVCNPGCSSFRPSVQSHSAAGSWSCKLCTAANDPQASHCCVCDAWRYSYGLPHASRPTL